MGSLLILVLIVLVAVFSVQNAGPVAISFLMWRFEASLAIVIFLVLLSGVVIGAALSFWYGRSRRKRARSAPEDTNGTAVR